MTQNLASVDITGTLELIVKVVVSAVPMIEGLTRLTTAKARQSAVVDLVAQTLAPAHPAADEALTLDPRIESATRTVIDAVVKLHKQVAAAMAGP